MSVPHRSGISNRFMRGLLDVAPTGPFLATAHKVLRRPPRPGGRPTGIGNAGWSQTPWASIESLARRVAATQDDFAYLSSFGPNWSSEACWHIGNQSLPLETMTRVA